MKKIFSKTAIFAAILLPLLITVSAQAADISVGNDTVRRSVGDSYENFTVIDTNHPVSADGWLTIFKYYAMDFGSFRFVLVDGSNKVQWVSDQITPAEEEAVNVFAPTSPVPVQAGWNLGVYFVGTGTIPFDGVGSLAYWTRDGYEQALATPQVGDTLTFDTEFPPAARTYSFMATGNTGTTPPPPLETVSVTIVKYLDGRQARAAAANNTYFLMNDTWRDPNTSSSGSNRFVLGPVGVNTTNPYQAIFASLTSGAAYGLSEDTSQYAVGTTCDNGKVYQLLGYTTGDTLQQAASATRATTVSLENIQSDKFIIVWNQTCPQTQTIQAGNDTSPWPIPRPILDTFGNFAIYDTNHPVSGNGWLTEFHYYAANQGAFRFFLVNGSGVIQWVSDEITPPGVGANLFTPASPVSVQKGWNVGLYFVSTGTIPYEYAGGPAYFRANGSGDVLPILGSSFGDENYSNRIYSFAAIGVTTLPPTDTVNVTTVKYLDGQLATATSANNNAFPMKALWSAAKRNAGFDSFTLGPNNPIPYQATSQDMASGAFYFVWEDITNTIVGLTCHGNNLYKLTGYTAGNSLEQAAAARKTILPPSLNNIKNNKFVIVWNETCETDDDCHDNGHHYGNDKGNNHKCKNKNNNNGKNKIK